MELPPPEEAFRPSSMLASIFARQRHPEAVPHGSFTASSLSSVLSGEDVEDDLSSPARPPSPERRTPYLAQPARVLTVPESDLVLYNTDGRKMGTEGDPLVYVMYRGNVFRFPATLDAADLFADKVAAMTHPLPPILVSREHEQAVALLEEMDSGGFFVPREFVCPLTHAVMLRPVVAADGNTYERDALECSMGNSVKSPLTGEPLPVFCFFPNRALVAMQDGFAEEAAVDLLNRRRRAGEPEWDFLAAATEVVRAAARGA
jgi:hypothetical protein